jgi:hypothetical protein
MGPEKARQQFLKVGGGAGRGEGEGREERRGGRRLGNFSRWIGGRHGRAGGVRGEKARQQFLKVDWREARVGRRGETEGRGEGDGQEG